MARELEMDISYQQVMSIARRLEGMLARDREEMEAKRSRETGSYFSARAPAARHGMDWLSPHYAILDYHAKTGMLAMPGLPRLEWIGTLEYTPSIVISFLKAQRMVEKGCDAYLAYVRDVSIDTPTVESVPVVRDFTEVFPADLSGMPPDRDIDFGIDMLPGTQPISIPLYRMAPPEFKEQLQELLDKGFIRRVSP
ncbi:uncharacterized protein [Nicotiana tomentosiformis]|uniref:uncharacterized protein n=1 Tax=Nicotiana tomentosiformis TaxID=4098 RepID=UPI00388CECF2